MSRQCGIDRAEVELACTRGYVRVTNLESSAHLLWRDRCRREGWPYLAVFPREPTLEVDLRPCARVNLEVVRAVYRSHRIRPECATVGTYHHLLRRRRAEPLARDLWAALTGKESTSC